MTASLFLHRESRGRSVSRKTARPSTWRVRNSAVDLRTRNNSEPIPHSSLLRIDPGQNALRLAVSMPGT